VSTVRRTHATVAVGQAYPTVAGWWVGEVGADIVSRIALHRMDIHASCIPGGEAAAVWAGSAVGRRLFAVVVAVG
jgi:hypothetical protein